MIKEIIEKAKTENKKVYIFAHKFPDGDAISSSMALANYLKIQGIEAKYVVTTPMKSFKGVVGDIPVTSKIESDEISIILDTSTVDYAQNQLFKKSSLEDIYVIDHHEKIDDARCIEDELGLPSSHVLRNSNASSVCEILVNELQKENVTTQIADMLTLGLLTDTAKLKFLKSGTLLNLSKLMEMGANYEQVLKCCSRKSNLKEEVGMAQMFLKTKKFDIGDTFGLILSIDNSEVENLNRNYRVRSPQKKIFKMLDIEGCSFNCISAENNPGEFNLEYRSTPIYGNFNVLQLAAIHNGGGHYNASGCPIRESEGYNINSIEDEVEQQAVSMYSEQAINLQPVVLSKQDKELASILEKTSHLSKGITPEILSRVDELIKDGANYEYVFKSFKTFEQFMIKNEILSRIPSDVYNQKKPKVFISLSQQNIDSLKQKYQVGEDEILNAIIMFSDINIDSATISLPDGRQSSIDYNGNIVITDVPIPQKNSPEL